MTSREWLYDLGRIWLFKWRLIRGAALPRCAMAWLIALDKWSAERALDKSWSPAASDRLDRILAEKDRAR